MYTKLQFYTCLKKTINSHGSLTIENVLPGFLFVSGTSNQYGIYYVTDNYVTPIITSPYINISIEISDSTLTLTNNYDWNNAVYWLN